MTPVYTLASIYFLFSVMNSNKKSGTISKDDSKLEVNESPGMNYLVSSSSNVNLTLFRSVLRAECGSFSSGESDFLG